MANPTTLKKLYALTTLLVNQLHINIQAYAMLFISKSRNGSPIPCLTSLLS